MKQIVQIDTIGFFDIPARMRFGGRRPSAERVWAGGKGRDGMELRNLTTFLRVAQLENVTRAAEQLGYAQSTVTTQIQQLEAEIGRPLFDRVGKKVTLTAAGHELIPLADQMAELSNQALSLGRPRREIVGELRIGVVESLCVWELCSLLPVYRSRYPRVRLRLFIASGRELLESLRKNELDLIFVLDKDMLEPDFVRVLAKPMRLVFVAAPENPLCEQQVTLAKVAASPLVLTESHGIYRRALEEVLLGRGLAYEAAVEANSTDVIVRLVKRGMGIAFLPEFAVRESVAKGQLAQLQVADCQVAFASQLFYHKNKWVTPQMDDFIHLLNERYEEREKEVQSPEK